jgi:hypothetical protein
MPSAAHARLDEFFAWQADPGSSSVMRLRPVLVRVPADDV